MAIIEYKNENGQSLWKAYVSVKSKVKPSIRVQKWKFNIKTQKQAEREEVSLLKECQAEVLKKESQGETWGNLVESWELYLREHKKQLTEHTRVDYISALRKHTGAWWKRPAREISRADVIEVVNQMKASGYTVSYMNVVKVIINRAFTYGMDHRVVTGIERSPAYGVSLGREEEKKPEILNINQLRTLLKRAKELNHPWYPVWSLAIQTGLRNGELYALLWEDVDFLNREITINKSYNCRTRAVKSTKAGYWRTIPISDELLKFLTELKSQAGERKEVLPRLPRWEHGDQARRLREFCVGVGLPSIKFHTLRACFATQLIRNGVPPIQIQKICGWRDLETMQRYIRLAGIEIKGATESLRVLSDLNVMEEMGEKPLSEEQRAS
ncbi:MAG: tyrosine-type recombinase/integrase [Bdellovibrionales bacterium]